MSTQEWPEERMNHIGQNGNDGAAYKNHCHACGSVEGQYHSPECPAVNAFQAGRIQPAQSSGGDNDYWVAKITEPKRLQPYQAECEDLIELFQFSFAEGNAFKALWRMGMDRVAQGKPGDTPLRNAEKVAYYGQRMVVAEQKKEATQ